MSSKYAYAAPTRELDAPPKVKRPTHCAVAGCMTHWNPANDKHEPGFADIVFTLQDGTVIARCAEHYLRHIYRIGKGSMSEITGRDWQITADAVKSYWDKLEAAESEKSTASRSTS